MPACMPATTRIAQDASRMGYDRIDAAADAPLPAAAGYLIRHLATGRDMPAGAKNVMELWRGFIEKQAGGTLENLQDTLADQTAFAKFSRRIIEDLGYGDQLGDDPDSPQDDEDDEAEETGEDEDEQET